MSKRKTKQNKTKREKKQPNQFIFAARVRANSNRLSETKQIKCKRKM